jgi:hypothetical protein
MTGHNCNLQDQGMQQATDKFVSGGRLRISQYLR